MKRIIRLSESNLHKIIKESVLRLLENVDEDIDIDPKNKGKFTATQKKSGKSTEELCHSKNPLTRKRANFAKMAKRHWKPLKETNNVFEDQWNYEIELFFNKLRNGEALAEDGFIAVEYGESENCPRYIYYKEGDSTLTDDYMSMQHSRELYKDELDEIKRLANYVYGIDIKIPDFYYDEETNEYYIL